jgi:hypothetical protein
MSQVTKDLFELGREIAEEHRKAEKLESDIVAGMQALRRQHRADVAAEQYTEGRIWPVKPNPKDD